MFVTGAELSLMNQGFLPGDTYPDMPWEPKAAFGALAAYYRG